MNELVFLENNQPVTTSLKIAEYFEREHRNVMAAIENSIEQLGGMLKNQHTPPFIKSMYKHPQNEQNYPMYLMNRDGFMFVAMGFTGEKATQLKWNYIQAFNAMEQILRNQKQEIRKAPTPFADKITDIGETARTLEKYVTGLKSGMALAQAIAFAEANDGLNYEPIKKLLPPAEHETGYLNASQVGEKLGLGKGNVAARKANVLLAEKAWQVKEGRDWRLTDEGTLYGEEMPYSRNGHSGYQIRWNKSVLEELVN